MGSLRPAQDLEDTNVWCWPQRSLSWTLQSLALKGTGLGLKLPRFWGSRQLQLNSKSKIRQLWIRAFAPIAHSQWAPAGLYHRAKFRCNLGCEGRSILSPLGNTHHATYGHYVETSSAKVEVDNPSECHYRTEPRTAHRQHAHKIWWSSAVRFSSYKHIQHDTLQPSQKKMYVMQPDCWVSTFYYHMCIFSYSKDNKRYSFQENWDFWHTLHGTMFDPKGTVIVFISFFCFHLSDHAHFRGTLLWFCEPRLTVRNKCKAHIFRHSVC